MFGFFQRSRMKQGQAPGSLVYTGDVRTFKPELNCIVYDKNEVSEEAVPLGEATCLSEENTRLYIATGIHDPEFVQSVGTCFNFPPLTLEDVMHTGQRSKLVWVDDSTCFVVMKIFTVRDGDLKTEQISIFQRGNTVLVFLEKENALLENITARIKKGKGRLRGEGGEYLLTAILDAVVDRQILALADLSALAEQLESELGENPSEDRLGRLYALMREVIILRNHILPAREVFKELMDEDSDIPESVRLFLHDTADHQQQALEGTTALHDIMKSMIDYQVSLIGIRTNRVMQFLTVIATIFIPLTFIAGVYGMNFEFMPELKWKFGYFFSLGVMGATAAGLLIYFIRKRLI